LQACVTSHFYQDLGFFEAMIFNRLTSMFDGIFFALQHTRRKPLVLDTNRGFFPSHISAYGLWTSIGQLWVLVLKEMLVHRITEFSHSWYCGEYFLLHHRVHLLWIMSSVMSGSSLGFSCLNQGIWAERGLIYSITVYWGYMSEFHRPDNKYYA
jgi:hypothetical protein